MKATMILFLIYLPQFSFLIYLEIRKMILKKARKLCVDDVNTNQLDVLNYMDGQILSIIKTIGWAINTFLATTFLTIIIFFIYGF